MVARLYMLDTLVAQCQLMIGRENNNNTLLGFLLIFAKRFRNELQCYRQDKLYTCCTVKLKQLQNPQYSNFALSCGKNIKFSLGHY